MIKISWYLLAFQKTSWKEKTIAVGIGKRMFIIKDFEYVPYLCIGIAFYFWYLSVGVRLPKWRD